jgi:phospholipid-binding lipoprotein MlaA
LRPSLFLTAIGVGTTLMATAAHAQEPDDPFERFNRSMFNLTMGVTDVFRPVLKIYQVLTPPPLMAVLHNMVTNLGEPVVIANDLLQGRARPFARDTLRVVVNSTLGMGGMVDVAAKHGYAHNDNDFGITLGVWGVRPGPYLFLPLLGPSTVRDGIGMGVDIAFNPMTWVRFPGHRTLQIANGVVHGLDLRLTYDPDLQALTTQAEDPYATLRSVYLQQREAQVNGEAIPPLPSIDEPPASPAPPPSSSAAPGPSSEAAPTPATQMAMATAEPADDVDAPIATAFARDRADAAPHYYASN